jgi:hypothetical protein
MTTHIRVISTTISLDTGVCSALVAVDGRKQWVTFGELRAAATQPDTDLAAVYARVRDEALRMEELRQNAAMRDRTRGHDHRTVRVLGRYGYQHDPDHVAAEEYDRRAAGGIVELEQCACGAVREVARNAGAEMPGQWQAPHTILLPEHLRDRARLAALGVRVAG